MGISSHRLDNKETSDVFPTKMPWVQRKPRKYQMSEQFLSVNISFYRGYKLSSDNFD